MRRVVWLNGAFGIGKSTVAELLAERLGDAIVFDPELIGAGLRAERAEWRGLDDFQDIPEWRDRRGRPFRARPSSTARLSL